MARRFKINEVEFTVTCEPEDIDPHSQFDDDSIAEQILKDLEWNEWAWCSVKVTAKWAGFEGVDYLGGCSYLDEADFRQPGGYFEDMQKEALTDLKRNIERAGWEFSEDGDVIGSKTLALTQEEKNTVHDYLFCRSAAKDLMNQIEGDNAFERVMGYLNFLRDRVDTL
jgi:hypothetical protein